MGRLNSTSNSDSRVIITVVVVIIIILYPSVELKFATKACKEMYVFMLCSAVSVLNQGPKKEIGSGIYFQRKYQERT